MNQRSRFRRPSTSLTRCAVALIFASLAAGVLTVTAQDDEWRTVDNPYQEDLRVAVGTIYSPQVEIDNVRWRSFSVTAAEGETITAGQSVQTEVSFDFENRGNKTVTVHVILLLEDDSGAALDRFEAKPFKVSGGRLKDRTETVTFPGDVLLNTRRMYVFCEITR